MISVSSEVTEKSADIGETPMCFGSGLSDFARYNVVIRGLCNTIVIISLF
jgi:hypothetical protein